MATMAEDRDASTVADARAPRARAHCYDVHVSAGPDAGRALTVSARSPGRLWVGSGEACHLRLRDRRVSRRHLALEVVDGGLRVVDPGSTNGTFVAGVRVMDVICHGGEVLSLGDSSLRIDVEREDPEAPDVRMAFGRVLGASLAMRRLYRTCDALARSTAPVLLEGEAGTGKLALAEALHAAGPLAGQALTVVEGALCTPSAIAEGRGTVFVRELGDVPFELQPAVATAIASAAARGARVVASTRRNLDKAVDDGDLREELLRELSTRMELPPLRARRGDIALLVEHFCRELGATSAAIPPKSLAGMNRADYPENVRDLRAAVAHALAAGTGSGVTAGERRSSPPKTPESLGLETHYRDLLVAELPFATAKQQLLERFAAAYVTYAVAAHGGHVARAAAASGLAPRYFNVLRARGRAGSAPGDGG